MLLVVDVINPHPALFRVTENKMIWLWFITKLMSQNSLSILKFHTICGIHNDNLIKKNTDEK